MPEPFTPVFSVDIDGFQVEVDASNKVRYTRDDHWTYPFTEEDEDVIVRLVKELVRIRALLPHEAEFREGWA